MRKERTNSWRHADLTGRIDDRTAWKAILELYFEDKVVEAMDLIKRTGAGEAGAYLSYVRLIEAEAISRPGSIVVRLASYLEVEFIPEETPGGIEPYTQVILNACARVSRELNFAHGPPTRLAFLSKAANAPWATSPHGYCMDMYPYEKLCMPGDLFGNPAQLSETVAHEYAHVATLNTTHGRATRWMEEAVSMQFESQEDEATRRSFVARHTPWLSPGQLITAFGSERHVEVWCAYQQSKWIGRYLRAIGGNESLSRLIRAMGDDSFLAGLWARIRGWTAEESTVRSVFGLDLSNVFERALEWLDDGKPGDPGPFPE